MSGELTMVDLFCGRGGASRAMKARLWNVVRVDHRPGLAATEVADLRFWEYRGRPIDLLWMSPPCDEFARESMPWCRTGQAPDLSLVMRCLHFVNAYRPRFWVLENVRGAQRWIGRAPYHAGPHYLWGFYPKFACDVETNKERLSSTQADERAEIPHALSLALALAVEHATPADHAMPVPAPSGESGR